MAKEHLIIATRGSKLALWQSQHVKARLEAAHPSLTVKLKVISTKGDRIQSVALAKIGDKGLFTQELEEALRSGDADIAVHSLKDLPTTLEAGMAILARLEREDHRDLLISASPLADALASLPKGARLGTSSLRRRAQAAANRPDLAISDLRGNVDTRLEKLHKGQHDAIILAAAGVIRLGYVAHGHGRLEPTALLEGLHIAPLAGEHWVSAVGQGVVAIEGRSHDEEVQALLEPLRDRSAEIATDAERAFMRRLEGGCQTPVAAFAEERDGAWSLVGVVSSLDGRDLICNSIAFEPSQAVESGLALAEQALSQGAAAILAQARQEGGL